MKRNITNSSEIPSEQSAAEAVKEESPVIKEESPVISVEFSSINGHIGKTEINFSPELFSGDSGLYNHKLAQFCSQFAMLGYGLMVGDVCDNDISGSDGEPENKYAGEDGEAVPESEVEGAEKSCGKNKKLHPSQPVAALEAIGMSDIVTVENTDMDQINYYIARREISLIDKNYILVFAGFIGSLHGQWYTNFDPGRGTIHKGFADAADFAYAGIHRYLEKIGTERDNIKLLLTGHSRGGAVANLLAGRFIEDRIYALPENIYTYTFAAPNAVIRKERFRPEYYRIFNIVNNEDFVTKVMPSAWGFGKYGTTLAFPEKNASGKWKNILKSVREKMLILSGMHYKPFPYGRRSSDKIINAITGKISDVDGFYDRLFRSQGEKISVQEYFIRTICMITAEPAGSELNNRGTLYMLGTFLNRGTSSPELRIVADFFVIYEGIGSATTHKISDMYFSYAHLSHTYCAFMLSIDKDDFIPCDE